MRFLKNSFKKLDPYVVGEIKEGIYLNANEAFYNTPLEIRNYASKIALTTNFNRYPDTDCIKLRKAISKKFDVNIDNVTCGVGSDELLDILLRATCEDKTVLSVNPTFGMYGIFTFMADGKYETVPLNDDFSYNVDKLIEKIVELNPIVTFVCNPNNPTGSYIEYEDVERIVKSSKGIVVLDEAYVDFAKKSAVNLVKKYDNLCVLRTFSKAYALAGIRCGYAISSKEIIDMINTVKPPYTLNTYTQMVAEYAISHSNLYDKYIKEVISNREELYKELLELGIECYKSEANFIYLYLTNEQREALEKNGVYIRYFKKYSRVTVGSKKENKAFLDALRG